MAYLIGQDLICKVSEIQNKAK